MKDTIKQIIESNLPEKTDERKVATFGEWQAETYGEKMLVNAVLDQINTSLIADEVLRVVVENLRRYIQKYLLEEHIHFEKEDTSDFIEEKPYIDSLEFEKWFLQLLSNLSPNKENKSNSRNY